jgi:valyl-tRNA synthetase
MAGYRSELPDRPTLDGLEAKWSAHWAEAGTYRFDRPAERGDVYSIDTPPPTVSGSLHVGHVFSYTHTDVVARYQRMRGKHVFYPMGWDDNGLPTERRVQDYYRVRCDPSLPYDADFVAPEPARSSRERSRPVVSLSRRNFVELCERLTGEDESVFEELWRRLGLSVDWDMTYTTIGRAAQRLSQTSFVRLVRDGQAYQSEAPTMWDVDFQTAVANAELVEKDAPSAYHKLRFTVGPEDVVIDTTRPELLPACVALVTHPADERYQALVGKEAVSPLFGVRIPVVAHELVDPSKGTGVAMVCTFGDVTDVVWWRELGLPIRTVVGRNGRLTPLDLSTVPTVSATRAQEAYDRLVGLTVTAAREAIVAGLAAEGSLLGEPRPIVHAVKYYEKGSRPLEIVSSRQWFIRTLDHREALLAHGVELQWHPAHMRFRYEDWVRGLNADWLVSRQRFFGVPIPVWYPLDEHGEPRYDAPILPDEASLPVDPSSDRPQGYTEEQRGRPGGFVGDLDVMDTWATSSLTPQLACGWLDDPELFGLTFPMDLRPQAHDIIRTWLFYTVVRAHLQNGGLPWSHAALSGWILDPDRKKMSKSQGNVVTPGHLLDEYGADAVRYWAASGRPGTDTAFDPQQMKIGRRLANKILNATRFVASLPQPSPDARVSEPLDRAVVRTLATTVDAATAALDGLDYTAALEHGERFFWFFCDDYLELVKDRAYGGAEADAVDSARLTLRAVLDVVTRLLAPMMPYTTEETWSWTHETSVHRAPWPTAAELAALAPDGDAELVDAAVQAIAAVRKAKSTAKLSMRADVARVVVEGTAAQLERLRTVGDDVRAAGHVGELVYRDAGQAAHGAELRLTVEL